MDASGHRRRHSKTVGATPREGFESLARHVDAEGISPNSVMRPVGSVGPWQQLWQQPSLAQVVSRTGGAEPEEDPPPRGPPSSTILLRIAA
jgi:hypothetical protein